MNHTKSNATPDPVYNNAHAIKCSNLPNALSHPPQPQHNTPHAKAPTAAINPAPPTTAKNAFTRLRPFNTL